MSTSGRTRYDHVSERAAEILDVEPAVAALVIMHGCECLLEIRALLASRLAKARAIGSTAAHDEGLVQAAVLRFFDREVERTSEGPLERARALGEEWCDTDGTFKRRPAS